METLEIKKMIEKITGDSIAAAALASGKDHKSELFVIGNGYSFYNHYEDNKSFNFAATIFNTPIMTKEKAQEIYDRRVKNESSLDEFVVMNYADALNDAAIKYNEIADFMTKGLEVLRK